ncbi:MAG TPA: class I SAM-dependent methyltransferase [Blastocatellia bacterium]|nr:class I SAM-dependent methyltransferase [Blastocatellia bacterium]
MGLYSKYIFPGILEWGLDNRAIRDLRSKTLRTARGRVLEIGFGTGLNLPYYPSDVDELVIIDPEQMLPKRVERRIEQSGLKVTQMKLDAAAALPFEAQSFDTVVTTFTLCSIQNVQAALVGIRRMLTPDGHFVFLEHGRSDDPKVARRQDRLNPLQKMFAAGCNINRPIDELVRDAGLTITQLERFVMPDVPRVTGEMYLGTATSWSL